MSASMLASRLWYALLGLAVAALAFGLYVAASMFDRASKRAMGEGLAADAQVVSWYLSDDGRRRSTELIKFALDNKLATALAKSDAAPDKVPAEARDAARKLLTTVEATLPPDAKFTYLFAVDQQGRVVSHVGFEQLKGLHEDFDLGGFSLVADALHGWIRDDTWVLDGRLYRAVARPVEDNSAQAPAGAIVGLRAVDDTFARELSRRTGAAVAFYAAGTRVASAAPEGFDPARLDLITSDLGNLTADDDYQKKGKSGVRLIGDGLGVVYARVPGEAWDLGAGYAVGRSAALVGSPAGFFRLGDGADKRNVPTALLVAIVLGAALVGLALTFAEHDVPLNALRAEARRLAAGHADLLTPSRFRGGFRRAVVDLNEGIEKVTQKGGVARVANLEQVIGPLPTQPAMSAFAAPAPGGHNGASAGPGSSPFGPGSSPFGPGPGAPLNPLPRRPAEAPNRPPPPPANSPTTIKVEAAALPPAALPSGAERMPSSSGRGAPLQATPPGPPPPPRPAPPGPPSAARVTPPAPEVKSQPRPPSASNPDSALPSLVPASASSPPQGGHSPAVGSTLPALAPLPSPSERPTKPPAPDTSHHHGHHGLPDANVNMRPPLASGYEDDTTAVTRVPEELIQASASRELAAMSDEAAEWFLVYEEFIRVKKKNGEPVEGITFDKFQVTLRKNRDTIVQQHACKKVRFTVYVKDGRAALKASPLKE